jgi:pimeloyl-ACP methyl ester carboxylesterase
MLESLLHLSQREEIFMQRYFLFRLKLMRLIFLLFIGLGSLFFHTKLLALPSLDDNFSGGIAIEGQSYQQQAVVSLSDTVDVAGEINVYPDDVGEIADLFVYAEATLSPSTETMYFMLGEDLTISLWDKNPDTLVAFTPNVTLGAIQSIPMYSGHFLYPGTLKVYFGYRLSGRLADGTLTQNIQPIDITINDNATITTAYITASTSAFIEVSDDAKIYYEISGEGTPLLLIHGGEFTDDGQPKGSSSWDPQYEEFAQHFKTIRLDLRGFGRSTLVGEHPLDSWAWAETEHRATTDVVELLNTLGIPKAHVLGLSIGSAVAAQLAVFHPEMVDKLILASPWWMNTLPSDPTQMEKLQAIIDKTLFIGGANDMQYSMELMFGEMAGYFPKTEVIENADHFCNRDQPTEFNKLVLDFLTNTASSVDSCTYDFEPTDGLSFSEQTQYGKTTVTTQPDCQWTASSNTDWITLVSGNSGNGTGTVTYAVAPNLGSDLKTGTVTIARKTLTITSPPRPVSSASCTYDVSPSSLFLPSVGDTDIIYVTTQPSCNWAASSNTEWVEIEWITVNHENGTGSVVYTADPNLTDSPKTGILTVAGKTVTATIATNVSNSEFVANFKGVEYYKPTGYCNADMILAWLLFEATGVNTSDLLYVEEKSVYQTDPANPYVESLWAFNSEGFIVRGFCAPPTLKSDFQVRLKEGSTGRLSNIMTFTVDVSPAVIDREAPPLTTTPGETEPTEPVNNDPILVSQVTDPDTELGFIATTGKETMGIFGTKDSQGRLVGINKISFGSQTDESQNLIITLDKDYFPTTMEFPDGSKVEYSNYTSDGATATYHHPDGSVANQAFVPMPFDDIQKGAEAIEQFVQSPQQTQDNKAGDNPVPSSADSNCKEVMGAFCNAVDNLFWGVFQLASTASCAAAATTAVLTGGLAIPIAAWACGSVILSSVARMTDVMTGQAGCGKDKSPLTQLSNLNDVAQGVAGGLAGITQLVADKILVEGLKEELDPEKVCQAKPENKCDAMEKLCDKYKGTLWPGGVPDACLCSVLLSLSQEEGKKFVEECKAIGGEPLGIVQCS